MLGTGELVAALLGIGQRLIQRAFGSRCDVNRIRLRGNGAVAQLSAQPLEQQRRLKLVELLKGGLHETVEEKKNPAYLNIGRHLASQGIAYVPFFPLGGFTPLQSSELDTAAASIGVTAMQLALAWLLQRSLNVLLIPGTSSLLHLRENLQASQLRIPAEVLADLNSIGTQGKEF